MSSDLPEGQQSKSVDDDEPLAQVADDAYLAASRFGAAHADAMDVAVKAVEARVRAQAWADARAVVEAIDFGSSNALMQAALRGFRDDVVIRMKVYETASRIEAGKAFPSSPVRSDRVWWVHRCAPGHAWFSEPSCAERPDTCGGCGSALGEWFTASKIDRLPEE